LIGQHQSALAYKLALKDGIGGHVELKSHVDYRNFLNPCNTVLDLRTQ